MEDYRFRNQRAAENTANSLKKQLLWKIEKCKTTNPEKREKAEGELREWCKRHPIVMDMLAKQYPELKEVVN